MKIATSKITAQGQTSIPQEVRRRLGLAPGSIVEWNEEGESIVICRAGRFTSVDIHGALFVSQPPPHSLAELKDGIRQNIKKRHARD